MSDTNFEKLKFTDGEFEDNDILSLPNQVLNDAENLKRRFDYIGKNMIALGRFNELLEYLNQITYPVGSIYLTTSSRNPKEIFGFGEWEEWGKGRVPVGVNSADADFKTAEKTGGDKTVKLTAAQSGAAAHRHAFTGTAVTSGNQDANHTHAVAAQNTGVNDAGHAHAFTGTAVTSGNDNKDHQHSVPAADTGLNDAGHTHYVDAVTTGAKLGNHSHFIYINGVQLVAGNGTAGGGYGVPIGGNNCNLAAEMQAGNVNLAHTHDVPAHRTAGQSVNHKHTVAARNTGGRNAHHQHTVTAAGTIGNQNANHRHGVPAHATGGVSANHRHSVTAAGTIADNAAAGASQAHNNMQPYITCYMWRRTA